MTFPRAPDRGAASNRKAKTEIYIPKLAGMEKRLARLLSDKAILTGGRLQMIGLQDVRAHIGGNWHRVEKAVHALTEEILAEHMGDEDVYLRYGGDKYLIIFASKTREAAEVTAAAIASAIRERLFDDETTAELKGKVMVETTIVSLDPAKMKGDGNPFGDLDREADRKRANTQRHNNAGLEDDITGHACTPGKAAMHTVYLPLWEQRRMAITAYMPVLSDSVVQDDEDLLTKYRQICCSRSASEAALLDLMIIQQALDEARAMQQDGRKFYMVCPVHIDTMAVASTHSQYIETCKMFPEPLRKYLVFNLVGVHEGIDRHALQNIVHALQSVGRDVWAMTQMTSFKPKIFTEAGVRVIGFCIPRHVDERKLMAWMDDVAVELKMSGMRAFLLDVQSLSVATCAVCAGFSMIGGPAVSEYVDRPRNATRFRHEDLFADLIGKPADGAGE